MLRRKSKEGASLAELLIAIAVLVVGLSGVAASLYFGVEKSKHGDEIATATQYSRMLIEMTVGRNLIDLNADASGLPPSTSGLNDSAAQTPRDLDSPPFVSDDFTGYTSSGANAEAAKAQDASLRDMERFKRLIRVERLGAKNTAQEHLARLTVTISWATKNEGGKQSVSTSTIIPLNSDAP